MPTRHCRSLSELFALVCMVSACVVNEPSQSDEVGSASIALTAVPNDVRCVRIDAEGPSRSTSQQFSVTPGNDAGLALPGLPLGMLSFSGEAFSKPCDEVSAGDTGDWASAAVTAQVVAGQDTRVQLVMKRNGRAVVEVSFDECAADAPPNLGQACGSCGGLVQCDASCSVETPPSFGQACGSCAGIVQCDGACSIQTPPGLGLPCGNCGGTTQCDGTCLEPSRPGSCSAGRLCCEMDECGRCMMCARVCP